MAGGYLGNIYNSGAGEPDMDSYKVKFVNIETSKFNANTARFMVVIAVLTMFVFSVLSYVDNKIVHMICMVLFNLASLTAIAGLIYLIVVHFTGNKQPTTTQPNENFDSMDKTAGIIIGSTLGVFAVIVIVAIVASTYMFRNVSGEDLVTIVAIDALAPRQNFMPRFTNGRRSPRHHHRQSHRQSHRRSHRRNSYFM
jgi:hypothetical protein